jgi:hypothetical protein
MLYALSKTFERFHVFSLLGDMVRFLAAAALILGGAYLVSYLPIPGPQVGRLSVALRLAEIALACLLIAWPALRMTGSITSSEGDALLGTVFRKRRAAALPAA